MLCQRNSTQLLVPNLQHNYAINWKPHTQVFSTAHSWKKTWKPISQPTNSANVLTIANFACLYTWLEIMVVVSSVRQTLTPRQARSQH
eukprot:4627361-Prorocentrum_lima.AAC.1